MTWIVKDLMSQRKAFSEAAQQPGRNMTALCSAYGISRKTGYKWLKRACAEGEEAGQVMAEGSRRPHSSPLQTPAAMEAEVLKLRDAHPAWGGRKLRQVLQEHPSPARSAELMVPAVSTIRAILARNRRLDLTESARHKAYMHFVMAAPNELWQMDYKGYFATGSGDFCHPLTVIDDHSRFLLQLGACSDENCATVQAQLTAVFDENGLPERMLMDNGSPWGWGPGSDGMRQRPYYTQFTVWLLRLGIAVSHTRVRHPQTQGKDERLHRTLNVEVIQRATAAELANLVTCQTTFDNWRREYNTLRPHEALNMDTPAQHYHKSPCAMPAALPPIVYPDAMMVRKVSDGGRFTFHNQQWRVGRPFTGLAVGLAPVDHDGCFTVYFMQHALGKIDLTVQTLPIQSVTYVPDHL